MNEFNYTIPEWLINPNIKCNCDNKDTTKLLHFFTTKNQSTYEKYIENERPTTINDWRTINQMMLSVLDVEIKTFNNFTVACNVVLNDETKTTRLMESNSKFISLKNWIQKTNDMFVDSGFPLHNDPVIALQIYVEKSNNLEEQISLSQIISELWCERNALSSLFSTVVYDNYGEDIYNQIKEASLFAEKAKKEADIIKKLRIVFPKKSELGDDTILEAFRNGDFDDEMDDYTLDELEEMKLSRITPYELSKELSIMCQTNEDWKEILPTILDIQFATKRNLQSLLTKIHQTYGKNDAAFIFIAKKYDKLDNGAMLFYNKEFVSSKEEAEFAINYIAELENIINETCEILKKEHGSIGFRRVMQYGMEAADVEDMKHFDWTVKMFGEKKAKELLHLTREEVAKHWGIPYDEELLDTPIDEWKDNPGR